MLRKEGRERNILLSIFGEILLSLVCLVVKEYIFLIRTINRDKEILNYNMQNNNSLGSGPINNDSSLGTPAIIYNNADTDKLRILTETKGKAPAEEPQALREGPGRPFPELGFTYGHISNLIKCTLVLQ
jgi:hypothetical protein